MTAPVPFHQRKRAFTHRVGECSTLRQYVNEATHGPCWKCGGAEATHKPENRAPFRLRPELGGGAAVVALAFGLSCRWAKERDER